MDTTTNNMRKIAYWPNGLWCDPETAALAVEFANYPSYQVMELPAGAGDERIEMEIALQLAKLARQVSA